jgi:hypothetical protein
MIGDDQPTPIGPQRLLTDDLDVDDAQDPHGSHEQAEGPVHDVLGHAEPPGLIGDQQMESWEDEDRQNESADPEGCKT